MISDISCLLSDLPHSLTFALYIDSSDNLALDTIEAVHGLEGVANTAFAILRHGKTRSKQVKLSMEHSRWLLLVSISLHQLCKA